jgi:predicted metal-dependent phosphoesterase TrpH
MKYDLHIHSKYSHDSLLYPSKIIKIAINRGLNGIAVTDHNTIQGGAEAKKANKDPDFEIIVGSEIKTEYGDIVGLFLNEDIKSRKCIEVVEEINEQGGLPVLAHPYRPYDSPEKIIQHFDYIEGFNARSKPQQNYRAQVLASDYNKKVLAGSDAHFAFEIGRGRTLTKNTFSNTMKNDSMTITGHESNYSIVHGLSVALEKIKRGFL